MLYGINFIAIIFATVLAFVIGGIWYSKKLFGTIWIEETGIKISDDPAHSRLVFGASFLFMLISATAFAIVCYAHPGLPEALEMAFVVSIFFVSTSLGINYFFAGRSLKLFLIDSGYHIIQFMIYGLVFGLWR